MPPIFSKVKNFFSSNNTDLNVSPQIERSGEHRLSDLRAQRTNPEEQWLFVGELGDGAFGKVQKAQSKSDSTKLAAAKSIQLEDDELIDDYLVEIEILSSCKHQNIVQLYDLHWYNRQLWIFLEFCAGGAVDTLMVELEKSLDETQIRFVGHEVTQALAYLHSHHVIHRDLKAGNILLTGNGDIKLADFGVSAMCKSESDKRRSYIGTPYWMAPEVLMCDAADSEYGTLADIWSLGITFIECAERDPPHSEMSPMRVVIKIIKSDPPKLKHANRWSNEFNNFVARCLQKDEKQRPTASQLLDDPFIKNQHDKTPILSLLNEARAEVIQEIVEEIDEDSKSGISTDTGPPEQSDNVTPLNQSAESDKIVDDEKTPMRDTEEPVNHKKQSTDESEILEKTIRDQDSEAVNILNDLYAELSREDSKRLSISPRPDEPLTKSPSPRPSSREDTESQSVSPIRLAITQSPEPPRTVEVDVFPENEENKSNTTSEPIGRPSSHISDDNSHVIVLGFTKDHQVTPSPKPMVSPSGQSSRKSVVERWEKSAAQHQAELSIHGGGALHDESSGTSWVPKRDIPQGVVSRQRQSVLEQQLREGSAPPPHRNMPNKIVQKRSSSHNRAIKPPAPPPIIQEEACTSDVKKRHSAHPLSHQMQDQMQKSINQTGPLTISLVLSEQKQVKRNAPSPPAKPAVSPVLIAKEMRSRSPSPTVAPHPDEIVENEINADEMHQSGRQSASPKPPEPPVDYELNAAPTVPNDRAPMVDEPSGLLARAKQQQRQRNIERTLRQESQEQLQKTLDRPAKVKSKRSTGNSTGSQLPRAKLANNNQALVEKKAYDAEKPLPKPPSENRAAESKENRQEMNGDFSRRNHRRTVTKKTRQFTNEKGEVVQTTTYHLMDDEGNRLKARQDFANSYNNNNNNNKSSHMWGSIGSHLFNDYMIDTTFGFHDDSSSMLNDNTLLKINDITLKSNDHNDYRSKVVPLLDRLERDSRNERKAEMHEFKRLNREEAREYQELSQQCAKRRQEQSTRFDEEKRVLEKNYEIEMSEQLRNDKKKLEDLEREQEDDLKATEKKIRAQHERELRSFREDLKQQQKLAKKEVEATTPKAQRTEVWKFRAKQIESEQAQIEREYIEQLMHAHDNVIKRLRKSHAERYARKENQNLNSKHQLLRLRESEIWEMEERHLSEKHSLCKQQMKDMFYLQRAQMLKRHQHDQDQQRKSAQRNEEELERTIILDKKRFPKQLRQEAKTRSLMFKESLRINQCDPKEMTQRVLAFDEQEKTRITRALAEYEAKASRRMAELRAFNESALKEMEEIQVEKRKLLIEQETRKLQQYDDEYSKVMNEFREQLRPRKLALEEQFNRELMQHSGFYDETFESSMAPGAVLSFKHPSTSNTGTNSSKMSAKSGQSTSSHQRPHLNMQQQHLV